MARTSRPFVRDAAVSARDPRGQTVPAGWRVRSRRRARRSLSRPDSPPPPPSLNDRSSQQQQQQPWLQCGPVARSAESSRSPLCYETKTVHIRCFRCKYSASTHTVGRSVLPPLRARLPSALKARAHASECGSHVEQSSLSKRLSHLPISRSASAATGRRHTAGHPPAPCAPHLCPRSGVSLHERHGKSSNDSQDNLPSQASCVGLRKHAQTVHTCASGGSKPAAVPAPLQDLTLNSLTPRRATLLQVRPLNEREQKEGHRNCIQFDDRTKQVVLAVSGEHSRAPTRRHANAVTVGLLSDGHHGGRFGFSPCTPKWTPMHTPDGRMHSVAC
eukprot:363455-Chlamydomonas_euryale.AAC.6